MDVEFLKKALMLAGCLRFSHAGPLFAMRVRSGR